MRQLVCSLTGTVADEAVPPDFAGTELPFAPLVWPSFSEAEPECAEEEELADSEAAAQEQTPGGAGDDNEESDPLGLGVGLDNDEEPALAADGRRTEGEAARVLTLAQEERIASNRQEALRRRRLLAAQRIEAREARVRFVGWDEPARSTGEQLREFWQDEGREAARPWRVVNDARAALREAERTERGDGMPGFWTRW